MNYSENCSLFIGLTTMPFGKEDEFVKNGIYKIFEGYKKKQIEFSKNHRMEGDEVFHEQFRNYFYEPAAYCLFGDYDLLVISLIDDFTLTNRNFHPYSYFLHNGPEPSNENFNYQIITGPSPSINNPIVDERSILLEKAKKTFLANHSCKSTVQPDKKLKYPLIAVTRVKINNSLIIGAGAKLVAFVEHAIQEIIDRQKEELGIEYIITESFSWNELTLVLFGDNYKKFSSLIIKLRELRLKDLLDFDHKNQIIDSVKKNSLLAKFIEKKEPDSDILESHVIIKTVTSFGFDFNLAEELGDSNNADPEGTKKPDIGIDLNLILKWKIKPGHLNDVLNIFKSDIDDENMVNFLAGIEDFVFPNNSTKTNLPAYINLINDNVINPPKNLTEEELLKNQIRKINTLPYIEYTFTEIKEIIAQDLKRPYNQTAPTSREVLEVGKRKHPFFTKELVNYSFKTAYLVELRKLLYKCNVSKILREKVLNMYANYNDGILDPILYIYFIELRPYLQEVKESIQQLIEEVISGSSMHKIIDTFVQNFETAFINRFHQSYRMDGVTDFNMEYNGGCQQIVSALDGAYKKISQVFGDYDKSSFVLVSGLFGVYSTRYHMELNFFHIFQPSIFISPVVKESVNQFFERTKFNGDKNAVDIYRRLTSIDAVCKEFNDSSISIPPRLNRYKEQLRAKQLTYFRSDIITYMYGYNFDSELFSFWYWNNFMQMSNIYDPNGEVNEPDLVKFMTRYLLVIELLDPSYLDKKSDPFNPFNAPNVLVGGLWTLHFDRIREYVRILIHDSTLKTWFHDVIRVGFSCITKDLAESALVPISSTELSQKENIWDDIERSGVKIKDKIKAKKERDAVQETRDKLRPILEKIKDVPADEVDLNKGPIIARVAWVKERQAVVIKCFSDGEIYEFRDDSLESPSLYLQTLFNSYLSILKSTFFSDWPIVNPILLRKNSMLKDLDKKGEVHDFHELKKFSTTRQTGKMHFDTMGGIFSANFASRRLYLKHRSTLMKSLWDFSLKMKSELFDY